MQERALHLIRSCLNPLAALAVFITAIGLLASPAHAICQAVAGFPALPATPDAARVWQVAVEAGQIRIRYIGHSTFELETPAGIRIATDYNDSYRPSRTPTIATMNRAHSTHFTLNPDPDISHLLPGWNPEGGPMDYDLVVEDVRVRNIQTNIRTWDGGSQALGNSIFIFEAADLCIAHLGHLHHRLTEEDLFRLGQIDIVFAAIDNSSSLRLESLIQVLKDIGPAMVIPMHFHFAGSLEAFIGRTTEEGYQIQFAPVSELTLSRADLPAQKTVYVMQPGGPLSWP